MTAIHLSPEMHRKHDVEIDMGWRLEGGNEDPRIGVLRGPHSKGGLEPGGLNVERVR